MESNREDVGIAIRSAFLKKGTQQRFSLFILIVISIILIFFENIETRPLNAVRSVIKDLIYRGAVIASYPSKITYISYDFFNKHITLYKNYEEIKKENRELKNNISKSNFLELENSQLRKLIDEQSASASNYISARVMLDKQRPYLNSFVINSGGNKNIRNGMAVLDGSYFVGRIVDVNFFSSRILLVSDLNSKISILSEPSGTHAILGGHGKSDPTLEYLPENHKIKNGDTIYTSGKAGIFTPGIPIGEAKVEKKEVKVLLFSDLSQITFVNIAADEPKGDE
jgi:rod shape-determining protein MreC